MLMTFNDFFDAIPGNEYDLVRVSDEIWKLGSIEEIRGKVCPELFTAHVAMNIIGNWQCDGWESIIAYHPDLLPHVPQALDAIGQPEIKEAFQSVMELFPEFSTYSDGGADVNSLYSNIVNFLTDVNFDTNDERLNQYSKETRAQLSQKFNSRVESLEELSDPLLRWDGVINYIRGKYDT